MASDWHSWQRERQRELISGGMTRSLARRWSKAEARGRERIAKTAGFAAAAAAPLDYTDNADGSTTWRLLINPNLIPSGLREAARKSFFSAEPGVNH